MKELNQQRVLQVIKEGGPVSRSDIAEITGLTPATVSNVVKILMERGLVSETRLGESSGGRKPVLLELNPAGAYVIGMEWGIASLRAVLLDLNGKVVKSKSRKVESFEPDYFIKSSYEIIDGFAEYLSSARNRLYGLGIGIHGLINPLKGTIMYAPHFKWENIRIRSILQEELDLNIMLDNDVRMMALAEKGAGRDNFVFINTGPGIGSAIVVNGNLLYGKDYSAGEFGHMPIVEKGVLCSCGNHGCLEALVSLNRLTAEYRKSDEEEFHKDKSSVIDIKKEWEEMVKAAVKGETEANLIIEKAAGYLGRGIAGLVNLLNPEAVIIGGDFLLAQELIFPLLRKHVIKNSLNLPARGLHIIPTAFGEMAGAIGAGTRILQDILKLRIKGEKE